MTTSVAESASVMVGRWVCLVDEENGRYCVGEITQPVGSEWWLVRFRGVSRDVPPSSGVFSCDDLVGGHVFDDEAALDAWLAWAEDTGDGGPKVVALKPRGEK